jgi:IS5 family transposase
VINKEKEASQVVRVHIQRKGTKTKPLSDCQKNRNNRISKIRVRVERAFAGIKQMGGKKIRTIGLARATLQLNLKTTTYNLKRLCSLKSCNIKSAFAF